MLAIADSTGITEYTIIDVLTIVSRYVFISVPLNPNKSVGSDAETTIESRQEETISSVLTSCLRRTKRYF